VHDVTSLSPIRRGFSPSFVNYKKGRTRLTAKSDQVYQLLAHGRWFSPGTPASSTTKMVLGCFAPNPVRPLSRFAPIPVRPYSRSPSFINSALKNEIWKIPLQIFVFWML
jgi:hypothetical protein